MEMLMQRQEKSQERAISTHCPEVKTRGRAREFGDLEATDEPEALTPT